MTFEEPEISISNYPPNGGSGILRPVAFVVGEKVSILIEIGRPDTLAITIGGSPEHEEIPEFLRDIAEMLSMIAESSDIVDRIAEATGGES